MAASPSSRRFSSYEDDFEDDEPIRRRLTLHVIQARGLPVVDEFSSDPYLAVAIGAQKFRTRAAQASTDPTWNKSFDFTLDDTSIKSSTLTLRIMDENYLKRDTHMCDAKLPVFSLRGGPWWCELLDAGARRGSLQLRFEWSPSPPPLPEGAQPFVRETVGQPASPRSSPPRPPVKAPPPAASLTPQQSWAVYAVAMDAWQRKMPRPPPGVASPPSPWGWLGTPAAAAAPYYPWGSTPWGAPPPMMMTGGAMMPPSNGGEPPRDAAGLYVCGGAAAHHPLHDHRHQQRSGVHLGAASCQSSPGGGDEARDSVGALPGRGGGGGGGGGAARPRGVGSTAVHGEMPPRWNEAGIGVAEPRRARCSAANVAMLGAGQYDGGVGGGGGGGGGGCGGGGGGGGPVTGPPVLSKGASCRSTSSAANRSAALHDFVLFDYDRSNTLQFDEFTALVRYRERTRGLLSGGRRGEGLSDAELRAAFDGIDGDGNGRIDLQEWLDHADEAYHDDLERRDATWDAAAADASWDAAAEYGGAAAATGAGGRAHDRDTSWLISHRDEGDEGRPSMLRRETAPV